MATIFGISLALHLVLLLPLRFLRELVLRASGLRLAPAVE
jgi:hypothetical protein